jgi:leucyl aminopeptidase
MLPPSSTAAAITRTQRVPGPRAAGRFDALLVVTGVDAASFLRTLPEAGRWQSLHQRSKAVAGSCRSTTLANERQSAAVIGHAADDASHFQRLTLAGRMLQEVAARRPAAIALCVDPALADRAAWFEALLAAALAQSFALPDFRSARAAHWTLKRIVLCQAPALDLARIRATAGAANLARWLTALPPNHLDVRAYRRLLAQLARRHHLQLHWYSESALKRLGAGAFLAVARGNAARDAGIARLRYRGQRRRGTTDVTLVGKGILFDTGGTNLKPHRSMLDMHTDMAGSAVALASMVALAELRAPLNVEAWLAITENNIGPTSYRPQEVVRAVNGRTIQVIHSDAEGRMALADTLALAARAKPALLLDYATLTGACVYALTERYSGIFTPQAALLPVLDAAGRASGERVWAFPLDEDFDSDIESRIADVRQCAIEGKGDHILATRFLSRFVPATQPWVHVDLSAATRSGGLGHINTEITGFGVRFTLELLLADRWRAALAPRRRRSAVR